MFNKVWKQLDNGVDDNVLHHLLYPIINTFIRLVYILLDQFDGHELNLSVVGWQISL